MWYSNSVDSGPIAQLVEHGPFKPGVVGSRPTRPTRTNYTPDGVFFIRDKR